jgi:hypothetical protein
VGVVNKNDELRRRIVFGEVVLQKRKRVGLTMQTTAYQCEW